jgi:acetolactate synthase-1/2/3 large subunit
MKASDYIATFLHERGVDTVFEVVGGMITHLLDSLHQDGRFSIISMHHEQSAAFAVDGYGRMRGLPAVAMATSGPGAVNLLTGIGSCHFDSVPGLFITGQVNRHELKGDRGVRQLGFQETDIVSMARPITKAAWLADDPAKLPELLQEAFDLCRSGRPGPVLIDIPMDVQRESIDPAHSAGTDSTEESIALPPGLLQSLSKAERPLVICGGGASQAAVREPLGKALNRLGVPVVSSLLGMDILPASNPLRVGFYGSYGNRWANYAVGRADWLLVLGSRLDIRQTGADVDAFRSGKVIWHVDVDASETNNRVHDCHTVHSALTPFVSSLLQAVPGPLGATPSNWLEEIQAHREKWPASAEYTTHGINPNDFLTQLSDRFPEASAYVTDVGQHQMWAAQSLALHPGQRFLTSGGMGAMGFGLPAAIGACLQSGKKPVVLIAGDGGFQLNLQEMQTLVRNRLPVKMVILNNHCHGMVRQFQQSYFKERYQSTMWGYDAPRFSELATAYGIPSRRVDDPLAVSAALDEFVHVAHGPALLEVMIEPLGNVYPKIAFGHPLTEMEPQVKPLEMEGT